jgi:hypothetical protein
MSLVSALGVSIIGAGVLAFRAISTQQRRISDYGNVELGSAALANLYGLNATRINTWHAPNYGRAIRADQLRDVFHEDIEVASAVYCLPRAGRSGVRPTSIPLASTVRGVDIDTPAAFFNVLAAADASTSSTFATFQGIPPANAKNASVFVIQPTDNSTPTELAVRCIWEIDIIPVSTSSASGTYATVRRYVGIQLTYYYDVFYRDDASTFGPPIVSFERAARSLSGTSGFYQADLHPFYFVWWPDPASPTLRPNGAAAPLDASGAAISGGDFRAAYATHYGQTPYFFVVPMFPCIR